MRSPSFYYYYLFIIMYAIATATTILCNINNYNKHNNYVREKKCL